jgi:O-antigen ligase
MNTLASGGGTGRPEYPVAVLRPAASRLELVVSAAVALTVLAFTLGSSSVSEVTQQGLRLRWICLFALLPLAALLVRARPRPFRVPSRAIYAIAGALLLLAFESALWSVRPTLTLGRATSLLVLVAVAALLGLAAAGRPEVVATLAGGLVAGGALVAGAGLVLLFVDRQAAVQVSSPGTPSRFRGLGQNPNTAALLAAILLPLAVWQLLEARTARGRALAGVIVLLLAGSVVGSGSYGALGASFLGLLVLGAGFDWPLSRRVVFVAGTAAAFTVGVLFNELPGRTPPVSQAAPLVTTKKTTTRTTTKTTTKTTTTTTGSSKPGKSNTGPQQKPVTSTPATSPRAGDSRLEDEIGSPSSGSSGVARRTIFGGSGRGRAWEGALEIGAQRPLVGYGFGTEEHVFVDRWYFFNGSRPENSVIGMFLQLGIVGVSLLMALAGTVVIVAVRVVRRLRGASRHLAAACAGAVIAASVLAVVQSYVYSVGNIGSVPLWLLIFLIAALSTPRVMQGND